MKILRGNRGFALVTSLMLTLVSLVIVMALMYMITQGTQVSAQFKKYKTALEASYGGLEILTKDVYPYILRNYNSADLVTDIQTTFIGANLHVDTTASCLQSKLTESTSKWPVGCSRNPEPKTNPDMTLRLASVTGNPFVLYSKIVDTASGNSDMSGLQLEGSGVAEGSTVVTPQHFPYIYRLEIQGEQQNNPTAQANLEVLYAY